MTKTWLDLPAAARILAGVPDPAAATLARNTAHYAAHPDAAAAARDLDRRLAPVVARVLARLGYATWEDYEASLSAPPAHAGRPHAAGGPQQPQTTPSAPRLAGGVVSPATPLTRTEAAK